MHRPARRGGRRVRVDARGDSVVGLPRRRRARPGSTGASTLPRHDVALDFGLGYGHADAAPDDRSTASGSTSSCAAGIAHNFELGFRMGFRLDNGGQSTQADRYGRPFDTETYGTQLDRVVEPRAALPLVGGARLRRRAGPRAARLPADRDQLALRVHVRPADRAARRAAPLRHRPLRPGPVLRPDASTAVSVPLHIWIQAAYNFWLGPMLGLRRGEPGQPHRLPARLRPRLADQPRRRHPHLVPVPRHEPARGGRAVTAAASRSQSGSSSGPATSRGRGGPRASPWAPRRGSDRPRAGRGRRSSSGSPAPRSGPRCAGSRRRSASRS